MIQIYQNVAWPLMPQLTSCSVCFSLLLSDTKQLLKQHDLLGADAVVCLDVLNFTSVVFTLIVNTFNLFACCCSSNIRRKAWHGSKSAALRVASCSLAQTESIERDRRLFTTWMFIPLRSLWNSDLYWRLNRRKGQNLTPPCLTWFPNPRYSFIPPSPIICF